MRWVDGRVLVSSALFTMCWKDASYIAYVTRRASALGSHHNAQRDDVLSYKPGEEAACRIVYSPIRTSH